MYGELERCDASQPTTPTPVASAEANLATLHNVVPMDTAEVLASCGQSQDQAKINNIRPLHGFNAVYSAPAELRMPERVALYSLVFGLQPRNCLEIGTFRGGSSAIICGAGRYGFRRARLRRSLAESRSRFVGAPQPPVPHV